MFTCLQCFDTVGWAAGRASGCKKYGVMRAGVVICLARGANDLHMIQLMPLPPRHLLLQQNPEWFILLVSAYPGCPGKKAVKTVV